MPMLSKSVRLPFKRYACVGFTRSALSCRRTLVQVVGFSFNAKHFGCRHAVFSRTLVLHVPRPLRCVTPLQSRTMCVLWTSGFASPMLLCYLSQFKSAFTNRNLSMKLATAHASPPLRLARKDTIAPWAEAVTTTCCQLSCGISTSVRLVTRCRVHVCAWCWSSPCCLWCSLPCHFHNNSCMSNVFVRVHPFGEQFACDSVLYFHRFTAMLFQLPSRDFFIMVSAAVSTHCHSQHLPGSSRQNLPCILEMPTVCVERNLSLQDVTRILVSMSVCLNGSGFHKNSSLKFSHHH